MARVKPIVTAFTVDPVVRNAIRDYAFKENRTISEIIRELLTPYLIDRGYDLSGRGEIYMGRNRHHDLAGDVS